MSTHESSRSVLPSNGQKRIASTPHLAGFLFLVVVLIAILEHVYQSAVTGQSASPFWWGAGIILAGFVVRLIVKHRAIILDTLPSVNLAVVLIAFVGLECTLGTLSLQKSDIESLSPDEQRRQFNYAEGAFLYRLFGPRNQSRPTLDERSEAYYQLLSEKFGKEYAHQQRKNALASQRRAMEDKAIEQFIADHPRLLDGIFAFMQVSGLFHMHTAWWFRCTLALLALNLIMCTLERFKWKLRQLGFALTHGGVLVIFLGAILGAWFEQKGMLELHLGQADTANSFFDMRSKQVHPLGFTVQLADFKTIYHKELFVEFMDVKSDTLPPDASLQCVFKVNKGQNFVLDSGRLRVRVADLLPQAILERKIVNLSNEPKNPAIQIRVDDGKEARHKWLFAEDAATAFVSHDNAVKIKYARPTSEQALRSELDRAKEALLGVLAVSAGEKKDVFPVRLNEAMSFAGYTIVATDLRPDFRKDQGKPEDTPPLNPAIRLNIKKDTEEEIRWVFQNFDFDRFHPPKFTDLKVALIMPVWEGPAKIKYLITQKGNAFEGYAIEGNMVTGPLPINLHETVPIGTSGIKLSIEQFYPDAGLERNIVPILHKDKAATSPMPEHKTVEHIPQPAVQLEIKGPGFEKTVWLLANSSEAGVFEQPGYVRIAYTDNKDKMPQEWRSHLIFLDEGKPVFYGVARVNYPVYFRGYRFYQADARTDDPGYSGIQVVYDPSWKVVNVGLLAVIFGVLFTFYVNPYLKTAKEVTSDGN